MNYAIDTFWGLISLLVKMFCIVVPLMVLLEIFREFDLIDKITRPLKVPARIMGFYEESIYPLLAGIIFGLSYGGGVLIGESDSGRIKGNQKFLVALYLGLCHAVFEDTLIFASLGANGTIVLTARLIVANVVVGAVSLFLRRDKNNRKEIRA
ncbi:MAG: nucleoside recognition protein [Candidatus Zixiibacteriota bacterium]|nr:MAG: nucleoside recognition protein [candidate division Zixibacteria bacterium]